MKPIKKTVIPRTKVPAPIARAIDKALAALDEDATIAHAEAVLAVAAKASYADYTRTNAESEALDALIALDEKAARRAWQSLLARWSAHAPIAGKMCWYAMARIHRQLEATIPPKLRAKARMAWAFGILSQVFEYSPGKSTPKPPRDGSTAWRQGCIEITLHSFDRARACVDAVRAAKGYDYSGRCLEIMLKREQGDDAGAIASYHELVALARKSPKNYGYWDVIAAIYVVLGIRDEKLAREIASAGKKVELSIFSS